MKLFLFPGQGSQYASMLRKFAQNKVLEVLKKCHEFRDDIIKLEEGTDVYTKEHGSTCSFSVFNV